MPDRDLSPTSPRLDEHIVYAGMTRSGKTTAALDMLSRRLTIPWLIVDHKREPHLKKLPHELWKSVPRFLPDRPGLYRMVFDQSREGRGELEELLTKIFRRHGERRANFGVFIDEGHFVGPSLAVRNIMVAGAGRHVPMMWISQRAQDIDPFIWSQAQYFRVFKIRGINDERRFNDNFPIRYYEPGPYCSHYFDGRQGQYFPLGPSGDLNTTIKRIDDVLGTKYNFI